MRFTNKRSSTSRRTPADAPSPVSETTDNALTATSRNARTSERVPATKPRPAGETNVAPFAEPPESKRGPASATDSIDPESAQTGGATGQVHIPEELIAARAYEIWERRGCPMGHETEQDWHAARVELEQEQLGWTQPRSDDRDKV
jgi:hypothetical protein